MATQDNKNNADREVVAVSYFKDTVCNFITNGTTMLLSSMSLLLIILSIVIFVFMKKEKKHHGFSDMHYDVDL